MNEAALKRLIEFLKARQKQRGDGMSAAQLSRALKMSKSTAQRHLAELETRGAVSRRRRSNNTLMRGRDVHVWSVVSRTARSANSHGQRRQGDSKYWVYKCNAKEGNFGFSDWDYVFRGDGACEWGSSERIPTIRKLEPGDTIFAYQTDRNQIVGIATVVRSKLRGEHRDTFLRPIERLYVDFSELRHSDKRIARFNAFSIGSQHTLYEIDSPNAIYLREQLREERNIRRYWRMAMREGSQGNSLWPQCLDRGIAAMYYRGVQDLDLVHGNRRLHRTAIKLRAIDAGTRPAQWGNLERFAFSIRKNDVIYVKDGPNIVARGVVTGEYELAAKRTAVVDSRGRYWRHQVRVDWDLSFAPITMLLGGELTTLLELRPEAVDRIELAASEVNQSARTNFVALMAEEGERRRRETLAFIRNQGLVAARKQIAQGECEICGMSFGDDYGVDDCLQVHHKDPLSSDGKRITMLDDLIAVCPNCHAAMHSSKPPLSPTALRKRIKEKSKNSSTPT